MKAEGSAVQYTLRNIPPALDRALRRRAKQLDRSLNEVALEALARGVGVERELGQQHHLDLLFASGMRCSRLSGGIF